MQVSRSARTPFVTHFMAAAFWCGAFSLGPSCVSCIIFNSLAADELYLQDGRVLEGEIISEADAEVIDLKTTSGGMSITQHIPKHLVTKITVGVTARQREQAAIAQDRAALGDGGSVRDWQAIMGRAQDLGDSVLARDLAQEVVQRDRHNVAARKLLGQTSFRGVWMRPNEANLAQGLVLYNRRYVSWDERNQQIADEKLVTQAREDARVQRAEERRQRMLRVASAQALASTPDPWNTIGYPPRSNYGSGYRAVYWPPVCPPVYAVPYGGGSRISIGASGGSGSFGWNFNWSSNNH